MKTLLSLCKSYEIMSIKLVKFHRKLDESKTERSIETNEYKVDSYSCKVTDIATEIQDGIIEGSYKTSDLLHIGKTYAVCLELV